MMSDDINLITEKMSEIMLKSEYDKVIFHDIAESYPTDSDIQCQYSLTENVIPTVGDLVAVFKVGWEAPHLYLHAEKASISEGCEISSNNCVKFRAENLPKDDGIFYQFCYICADGVVRGASTPFRFRAPTTDELIEVEDTDSDLLVIRTRTAVIEEKLWEMAVKNSELLKCKAQLEKELKHEKAQLNETEEKLAACKDETKRSTEELENAIAEQHRRWQDAFDTEQKRAADDLTCLKNQMNQNEAYIEELRTTIKLLAAENEKLVSKLNHAKLQIEVLQKQAETTDLHLQTMSRKNEKLIKVVATEQGESHKLQQQICNLELKLSNEQKKYADVKKNESLTEQEKHELTCRLIDTEHMLTAMEKSKHMATEELMAHSEFKNKLTKEFEETKSRVTGLQEQYMHLKVEREEMQTRMNQLQADYQELIGKYKDAGKELEKHITSDNQWMEEKANLLSLVDDLKQRLQAGAVEYQAKYIECFKLEKKLGKMKKRKKERTTSDGQNQESGVDCSTQDSASQCESSAQQRDTKTPVNADTTSVNYENMLIAKDITIQTLQQQLQAVKNALGNLPAGCFPYASGPCQPQPSQSFPAFFPWVANIGCGNVPACYPTPRECTIQNIGNASNTPAVTTIQPTVNADHLPPPIQPEITALAKLAAITAVTKHFTESHISTEVAVPNSNEQQNVTVPPEHPDDIESDGPAQASAPELPSIPTINKCPVCNNCFTDLPILQEHIEIHFVQNCPVCNQPFDGDQQGALEAHVNSHFDQDPSIQRYDLNFD